MYNRNNTYLHPSTSVVGLNANEILLHHHGHVDFHSGNHYLTGLGATNTPVLDASTLFNDINGLNGDHPSTMSTFPRNQKAAKKDRHSKINTAQGPRDRRVRLSIGIARKFFDLQEMLGFDKPSKTLDWLLTKSKTAIKDLVQMKSCKSTNSTSGGPSDCNEEVESCPNDSKGKSVLMNGNKVNLAKESRAKARARARERTKEKMCIKAQLNEASRYKGNYQYQYEVSGSREPILHCPLSYEEATIATQEELIQESIVIKRRFKQLHPQIFGFNGQQNLNVSTANGNENWDYSNFSTSQSNNQLCAILDHHKFIN